ncbi:hypothetical protein COLO4_07617 [Corchorus olitorius]|uniref:Uncharacterized protein n=1 Tax=Corchorus olitorius TaxID=93759 RepID=A0A1R3KJ83_9ROSI|nr:hypothetical protein COLO4_07617 [Corchorus olitorius]
MFKAIMGRSVAVVMMAMRMPSRWVVVPNPIPSITLSKSTMESTIETVPTVEWSPIPPIHHQRFKNMRRAKRSKKDR